MSLSSDRLLNALRAIAEDTRLRIVALLRHGELTVTDLTDILGQTQPRISRHLRLLTEAGVVDKHREGTRVFFELVARGPIHDLSVGTLDLADQHDPTLAADLDRLAVVRRRRAGAAHDYFAQIAERWDEERSLHAPDEIVEAAIVDAAGDLTGRSLLDLGTGTGRMLQLLGGRTDRAVGLDNSHSMLAVARANLERAEMRGVDLRQGDVYTPPFPPRSFDLVVIHQVLHFLDDPARAVREAAHLVARGGRLIIVDFAPHSLEFLRSDHAHHRLGFRGETIVGWLTRSGLEPTVTSTIDSPTDPLRSLDDAERLTVTLWVGIQDTDGGQPRALATSTSNRSDP